VTVIPESVVYHVGGGTLPASSPFKLFLNFRNNLLMLDNNLSKTFALECYNKGMDATNAAVKGHRKACRRIFTRKILDGMSAAAYLLTFKWSSFNSVLRAHKEYRRLKNSPTREEISCYLSWQERGTCVKGIYSKWIILQSIFKGEDIFGSITEEDFYKI
jgi:hypothetical protein